MELVPSPLEIVDKNAIYRLVFSVRMGKDWILYDAHELQYICETIIGLGIIQELHKPKDDE